MKIKINSDKIVKMMSKFKFLIKDLVLIKVDLVEFEGWEFFLEKILKDIIKEESWLDLDFVNDNIN